MNDNEVVENLDRMFEEALKGFNFEPVKKTMRALDWKWNGDLEPPSQEEMVSSIRRLYQSARAGSLTALMEGLHNLGYMVCSGGFSVSVLDYREHGTGINVEISFVVEDSQGASASTAFWNSIRSWTKSVGGRSS